MERKDTVWQAASVSERFLDGVRGAIPLAAEQIDVILRILKAAQPSLGNFLDLGCGDGILGRAVLSRFPGAQATFLDFSEPMLKRARESTAKEGRTGTFMQGDFGLAGWDGAVRDRAPFDAIVSGYAIHHLPDPRKREVYGEIFKLLAPGGLFLNLEHVASATLWVEKIYDELSVDRLYEFHTRTQPDKTREQIANEYYYRPDKAANILAPVELQCQWLREIGYEDVDCYMKIFELALFGGKRPVRRG
jgi:SAM-dependent methyltransferase